MGLAKIFEKADIPKFRILENPPNLDKSTILIDQDVVYYRKAASDPTKVSDCAFSLDTTLMYLVQTVNSLLTIKTDSSHLITTHTEEWNHCKETSSDDGFFGMLNEQRKKITAGITDMFVGKEPEN